ncbi:hypothetical protein KM043_001932 [Ampulex compressa]|nr:hypothetical protein KM043_001932 [Ampulex compressa]
MPYFPWHCIILWSVHLALPAESAESTTVSTTLANNVTRHPNWALFEEALCGSSSMDRIIGGKNASLGAYRWIARIGYTGVPGLKEDELTYRCGGTLISRLYVVTAAHCVSNLPGSFKVSGIRLGEHNTATDPDCEDGYCGEPVQDFQPATIIVHADYNQRLYKNDIAIIRLDKPAVYNGLVRPICMVKGELLTKNFVGEMAEVAGWGIYDINDPKPSTILQTLKVPIVATEQCAKAFKSYTDVGERQLCVGGVVGEDSCGGDSGGPLMKVECPDDSWRYYFIGVVSFGTKHCGESATPAVYSKVSSYISWILDNMSE